ncbi:GNAT family N-acetyltransferase [Nocardia sp. NPDC059177]|uniref:GNAT family N-acetyltransferase n=1 Tax=Nocardia sp. NPDC059177 TaxID=3346759 RepID=UPI00369E6558
MSTAVRRATPADVATMVELVHELAAYEKAPEQCTLTAEQLHTALFGPSPALFAHVAEHDGVVAGCAIWFLNYSTWDGVHGIYLEDLYVRPATRGSGLGRALVAALAAEAVARGYSRVSWSVLTWNTPSIAFYESLGAAAQDEWIGYRLAGAELAALAATVR